MEKIEVIVKGNICFSIKANSEQEYNEKLKERLKEIEETVGSKVEVIEEQGTEKFFGELPLF